MPDKRLILVLGDQLSLENPALKTASPGDDVVVLAEVAEEATYVRHNRHKIALIFAERLREGGFDVIYYRYGDGVPSLEAAVRGALASSGAGRVQVCEPGEYRLKEAMDGWPAHLGVPVDVLDDSRFLASNADFAEWAEGRKQLRMEYFYREMRKRYGVLLEPDGKPAGDKWNYDSENRKGWRAQVEVPERPEPVMDAITREVIEEVQAAFPENPGDLSRFCYAVTPETAQAQFDWFCDHALPLFGTYQDGLAEESPWLFHALISMYLNIGLREPLPVCQQVERAWRDGKCSLAAAEGFIRQVLGWREYVRGIYWLMMPDYKDRNTFEATTPLPDFYWNAETDLRCLSQALAQSLDLGYGHHIQRLMVIGNFALLAGLSVQAVCDWYLRVGGAAQHPGHGAARGRGCDGQQALRGQRQVHSAAG